MGAVELGEDQEEKSRNVKPPYKGKFAFLLLLIILTDRRIEVLYLCHCSSFARPLKQPSYKQLGHAHLRWPNAGHLFLQFLHSAVCRMTLIKGTVSLACCRSLINNF